MNLNLGGSLESKISYLVNRVTRTGRDPNRTAVTDENLYKYCRNENDENFNANIDDKKGRRNRNVIALRAKEEFSIEKKK